MYTRIFVFELFAYMLSQVPSDVILNQNLRKTNKSKSRLPLALMYN